MSGGAVVRAASAGALRRVVQSTVVLGVLAFSTAAALLALAVLTNANLGFFDALAAQHEAQVAVTIDAGKVTAVQLVKTRQLSGVTNAAGPYPETTITATTSSSSSSPSGPAKPAGKGPGGGQTGGGAAATASNSTTFTVVGRASPSGPLHRIQPNPNILDGITHGHSKWPSASGEISLAQTTNIRVPLGSAITVTSAPGKPKLTVVGYASQTLLYDGGWVLPSEIARLRAKGAPAQEEMLYNFASAGTSAQIASDIAALKRALPAGAIVSSSSYLPFEQQTDKESAVNTPFITTFAIIALILSVLIVANVLSAAVIASYRRIGVLKSIGFTPSQVTAVYLAQIGLPAVVGAGVGAVLGNHWALPLIQMAPVPTKVSVPTWMDFAAPLGMLGLSALAAGVPALRAGQMSAVAAIAAGQAPPAARGYLPHRLASRLPLPRPISVGLAAPFSRPSRSAITVVSIAAGLAAVVLAVGLSDSIYKINHSSVQGLGQVQVTPLGARGAPFTPSQVAAVSAAISGQPGTHHYVAESDKAAGAVAGPATAGTAAPGETRAQILGSLASAPVAIRIQGPTTYPLLVTTYEGNPAWLGWALVAGHWYHAGQIDASPQLLAVLHKHVGQKLTMTVNGTAITVRIAGEVFVPLPIPAIFANWRTLGPTAATKLAANITSYDINLKPGTNTNAYIHALTRKLGNADYDVRTPAGASVAAEIKSSYFHLLAVLVAVLAALGVLNSVLMATRERLHDLGVFKALGMTPAQTIEMVLCWVIAPTVIAAIIALPVGLVLQDKLIRHLASSSAHLILPGSFVHVLSPAELALLTIAGLAIAAAGALGPAAWAAVSRATTALRAE